MELFRLPSALTNNEKRIILGNSKDEAVEIVCLNICSGGTPSASTGTAANAFDDSLVTEWQSSAEASWLKYDFGISDTKEVKCMAIYCDGSNGSPEEFTIQGSHNDSDWDTLETITGEYWLEAGWRQYLLTTQSTYRYYRINITDTKGDASAEILQVEMYDDTIFGEGRVTLFPYESFELVSDSRLWIPINSNPSSWKKIWESSSNNTAWASGNEFNIPITGEDKEYMFVVRGGYDSATTGDSELYLRFNGDSGSNYSRTAVYSRSGAWAHDDVSQTGIPLVYMADKFRENICRCFITPFVGKYTPILSESIGADDDNNRGLTGVFSGFWQNTTDKIRNIQLYTSGSEDNTLNLEVFRRR